MKWILRVICWLGIGGAIGGQIWHTKTEPWVAGVWALSSWLWIENFFKLKGYVKRNP